MLVLDANGNGLGDGREEVSFAHLSSQRGATDLDGLHEAFDSNHDGFLTAEDDARDSFKAWQGANGNGLVDDGEMRTLSELGITSISLYSDGAKYYTAGGDVTVHGTLEVQWADGRTTDGADDSLRYEEIDGLLDSSGESEPLTVTAENGATVDLDTPEALPVPLTSVEADSAPVPPPFPTVEDEAAAAAAAVA